MDCPAVIEGAFPKAGEDNSQDPGITKSHLLPARRGQGHSEPS